jgi:DNA-binding transcriptional regulator LsrR (DeoR family)
MRAIPEVITIAYGTAKIPAAHAVLRSGLISGLVTHKTFAQALLDSS